jgi:hypothetical protein
MRRAKNTVFWIPIRTDITHYVKSCSVCQLTQRSKPKEELIVRSHPTRAFEEVDVDIFTFKKYILIVDAFSNFYDFKNLMKLHRVK